MMVGVSWNWGYVTRVSQGSGDSGVGLTHVDHLLETLGANTVQTAQQFGLPAAGVVAVIANLALKLLQCVYQGLSP